MIVAFGKGRAGNLMFQLGGITACQRYENEKLVLVGFHRLKQFFPTLDSHATLFAIPDRLEKLGRIVERVLNFFSNTMLIGRIRETYPDSTVLVRRRGLLPIALFRGGWCQSEKSISNRLLDLLYRESLDSRLSTWDGASISSTPQECFVHIRRGDFLVFPSNDFPAVLPEAWYRKQMSVIAKRYPGIVFRFFSDEIEYVANCFSDIERSVFDYVGDHCESFIAMSRCQHGILSASSYSWWAAYFAHARTGGSFIAPRYWSGWRMKRWHPYPQIQASFLQYDEVSDNTDRTQ